MVWATGGLCPAKIEAFNCADTVHSVIFNSISSDSIYSTNVTYIGGNGGFYTSQTIPSTGVTGLTATLAAGTLNSGSGKLKLNITGTPKSAGIASFLLVIGNISCTFQIVYYSTWPSGTVFCNGIATAIVNVTNPITGKTWMDRNLGASRAATFSTDADAYGDLYQWGRTADGHQCRNSGTTSSLSSTDQPDNSNFILAPNSIYDWRSPQNDNLWQGVNGVNNPCPLGYRIPSFNELNAERTGWSQNNSTNAINSPLKLPVSGYRSNTDGSLNNLVHYGIYWSNSVNGANAWNIFFFSGSAYGFDYGRASGFSVRCIKD